MKKLFALGLAFASMVSTTALVPNTAQAQAALYAEHEGLHWISGQTVTITYSPSGAPSQFPPATVAQVLGQVEAKLNGLGIDGLNVRIGRIDLPNACSNTARNTVHICWEVRDGRRADSINTGRTDGTNFWREGLIILGNQADWNDPTRPLYQQVQHYLLHILGFAHPDRAGQPSVINNNSNDLTQLDIDGLRNRFSRGFCAVNFDGSTITLPFVRYQGMAYTGRLQRNGNTFTIVPGTLGRYGNGAFNVSGTVPTSPCQSLEIDGRNELYLPAVRVDGSLQTATLRFTNGQFTLISQGQ